VDPMAVLRRGPLGNHPRHRLCAGLSAAGEVHGQRRNLAALATVAIIVAIVILPATLITASLVQEASGLYERFRSGELNLARNFQQVLDVLPAWVTGLLHRFGLTDLATVQQRLADILMRGSQFLATQAINIGQTTFAVIIRLFIMLYLLFFLLRDGEELFRTIKDTVPLGAEHQRADSANLPPSSGPPSKAPLSSRFCRALSEG
jgi:predicted PurR-regulated permease PerM